MSTSLKILFIQSSGSNDNKHGERLEIWSQQENTKIETTAITTNNSTVDAVTKQTLEGDYDAVIVEEAHGFDNTHSDDGFAAREQAYKQLGLNKKKERYEELDPNYGPSGIALVQYLKQQFNEAGKDEPKFGYISMGGIKDFEHNFKELGIKNNADFYLSTGYESPEDHVQKIYEALGIK